MATRSIRYTTSITHLARRRRAAVMAQQSLLRLVLVFAALLVAVDLVVGAPAEQLIRADPAHNSSSPAWRLALYHAAPPPDVLILGSSRVQTGLDPAVLAATVAPVLGTTPAILDLGLVWSTPQVDYWLLKNDITPDKQPRAILYGVSEYAFNANSPAAPDYDAEDLATLADYPQAFPDPTQHVDRQLSFLVAQFWPLFRYRTVLHDTLQDLLAPDPAAGAPAVQDPSGFLPVDHVMSARDVQNTVPRFVGPQGLYRDFTVGSYQANQYVALLQLAQARGIRIAVVNLPITTAREALLPPGAYAAYRAFLRTTCARYGVPFADYDDHTLFQEPGDFLDPHHLNRAGAARLSPLVARDVLLPLLQRPSTR